MSCYNLERIPPENKVFWYECMMCKSSNYQTKKYLDTPSSNICTSNLCRLEFALLYSENEEQLENNLKELIK